ncbi:hypothetical protein DWX43_09315 [Clostridium sp. AF19-22AC]|jgi:neutral ceramidase|uniref:hypothetical protein n=1 Tax=Clostridia TaxID=186801 RepID=UPI000E4A5107|nr:MULTISPECIES: hypothetical protein [Clostridia]RHR30354.1 hypothetical protein DWX43_09315 [Clostridium sp. AF19-22AC]
MRVGAGKARIILKEEFMEPEEFGSIHLPLHARALFIESVNCVLIVSLELTSLPDAEANEMKREIAGYTGLGEEQIWICTTHTFSAPHLGIVRDGKKEDRVSVEYGYLEAVKTAVSEAVRMAAGSLEDAGLQIGTGYCDINTGRDVELPDGWWIGKGDGLTDHEVTVLRFLGRHGRTIAILYHYAVQSSVLDGMRLSSGMKVVSPDITGIAGNTIEKYYEEDGAYALFLVGAAGDQAPVKKAVAETYKNGNKVITDAGEQAISVCEKLGRKLGRTVIEISQHTQCVRGNGKISLGRISFRVRGKKMEANVKHLYPARDYVYVPDQEREVCVEALCLGNLAVVGVKPELNCITAIGIKERSPFPYTIIATMVNGSAKYMADKKSYERCTYEAMNSPFYAGAAEILAEKATLLLEQMQAENSFLNHTGDKK